MQSLTPSAGILVFSEWSGLDDKVIQAVQRAYAHFHPELKPYADWTHVQLGEGNGSGYEAAAGGVVFIANLQDENNVGNGLKAMAFSETIQLEMGSLGFADFCAKRKEKYDWLAFLFAGITLWVPWLVVTLRHRHMCSGLAAHALEHEGYCFTRPALLITPMHLAQWAACPHPGRTT